MIEPDTERIVGYPEIAMSVITYSNPGDVTAELVWVGDGTNDNDYTGKDVRGKFVLATGYGGEVHRLAVLKYGAKAVVCYLDDERAKYFPDMLQYTGMWPRTEELSRVTFGFNDVVENMAEMIDNMDIRTPRGSLSEFNYRMTPYSGGSDHMMFIDRKIPGIMFSHSDYTHHTSEDTPDKVDPVELERCEIISAGTMWYLSNLTSEQASDLAYLVSARASARIDQAARKAFQALTAAQDAHDAHTTIEHALWQELGCVSSILDFNEIRDALSAEFSRVPLEVISHYLNDLARAGAVKWK